jgi:FkbM family methyltransferase
MSLIMTHLPYIVLVVALVVFGTTMALYNNNTTTTPIQSHRDLRVSDDRLDNLVAAVACAACPRARVQTPMSTFEMVLHEDGQSPNIDGVIARTHIWEPEKTAFFEHAFANALTRSPLDVFLDVGANIGYFSMLAASHGLQVHAFEALRYNVQPLRTAIIANGFSDRVHVHYGAVSDERGRRVCMVPWSRHTGKAWTINRSNGMQQTSTDDRLCIEYALTDSIDAMLLSNTSVFAAKLDCEGCEGGAVRSMKRLLSDPERAPCFIQLENKPADRARIDGRPDSLYEVLYQHSYQATSMRDGVAFTRGERAYTMVDDVNKLGEEAVFIRHPPPPRCALRRRF